MSNEYREQLCDILRFTNGRRILTLKEVRAYTGFADNRTIKRRFSFQNGYITAVQFALQLSGGNQ